MPAAGRARRRPRPSRAAPVAGRGRRGLIRNGRSGTYARDRGCVFGVFAAASARPLPEPIRAGVGAADESADDCVRDPACRA